VSGRFSWSERAALAAVGLDHLVVLTSQPWTPATLVTLAAVARPSASYGLRPSITSPTRMRTNETRRIDTTDIETFLDTWAVTP
jgi:hypothetical protein